MLNSQGLDSFLQSTYNAPLYGQSKWQTYLSSSITNPNTVPMLTGGQVPIQSSNGYLFVFHPYGIAQYDLRDGASVNVPNQPRTDKATINQIGPDNSMPTEALQSVSDLPVTVSFNARNHLVAMELVQQARFQLRARLSGRLLGHVKSEV